jgi:hypothetical protein
MAQHISLLLEIRSVSVCKNTVSSDGGSDYGILVPLGHGFAHMSVVYWDKPVGVECEMKIAKISSGDGFLVLQAHDGYYERTGWSWLYPSSPRIWAERNLLWCLTDDKFMQISLSADGKLEPLDEERLRAAFGDIEEDHLGYGQDEFQEELVTLG